MPLGKSLISFLIFLMHKEIFTVMAAKAIVFCRHVVLLGSLLKDLVGVAGLYYLAHTKQQLCASASFISNTREPKSQEGRGSLLLELALSAVWEFWLGIQFGNSGCSSSSTSYQLKECMKSCFNSGCGFFYLFVLACDIGSNLLNLSIPVVYKTRMNE